jgi:hypothetical protein
MEIPPGGGQPAKRGHESPATAEGVWRETLAPQV